MYRITTPLASRHNPTDPPSPTHRSPPSREDSSPGGGLGDDHCVPPRDPITPASPTANPDDAKAAPEQARHAIRQGDYPAALRTLRPVAASDPESRFTQNLARNLAQLARHRPDVLSELGDPTDIEPYRLIVGPTGHPTVARTADGVTTPLAPKADPIAQLKSVAENLPTDPRAHGGFALIGAGDGYLLQYLAQQPDGLLGMQQAVYLIEPDPRLVCAMLHVLDHGGSGGAIAQGRFQWFVGEQWALRLAERFDREADLPRPASWIQSPPHGAEAAEAMRGVLKEDKHRQQQVSERLGARAADPARYDAERLAELFEGRGDRAPRALLLTSRFTTVLQYATQDTAAALEELGWETRMVKEADPWRRTTARLLAEAFDAFDPDMVFQIDHLRQELAEWFPNEVPFVCWIQDHLAHLTDAEAGRKLGRRDFVLTSVGPLYTDLYEYPARQVVGMAKLTRVPPRPAESEPTTNDLAYVSNASRTPAALREDLLANCAKAPKVRDAVAGACDELMSRYERGESVSELRVVGQLLDRAAAAVGIEFPSAAMRRSVVTHLFEGVNNALYRQQALGWAAQIAEDMGLSFALYGQGWDEHPDFARFARGPIAYGPELEATTRRTRINLQIVPYFCLHQRLLDGLVAGGFFLVRHHPTDDLLPGFSRLLETRFDPEVHSVEDARAAARGELRDELEWWLDRTRNIADIGFDVDIVQWVRGCQQADLLGRDAHALPDLGEVSFADADQLRERIDRFMNDSDAASRIAQRQRSAVETRLTYTAGVGRAVRNISALLRDEAAQGDAADAKRVA